MKKLMIAAAIVCAAAISQAATANWNWASSGVPGSNQVIWDNGSTKNLYTTTPTATIYLFDVGVIDQDTLLAGLRDQTYKSLADAASVKSSTLDGDSKLKTVSNFGYGTQTTESQTYNYNFYMAVMDNAGNVFLSKSTGDITSAGNDNPKAISFSGLKTASQNSWTSNDTFTFGGDGGKGAGWYAVPEPTSGLLLLLGVAGLALRRRRA